MTIVIDTPEGINAYYLLSVRSSLGLEVKTQMRFSNRVNVFKQAKDILLANDIKPAGTKAKVYTQLNELLVNAGFEDRSL